MRISRASLAPAVVLALAATASAQVAGYSFSQSVGTYTPITAGTLIAGGGTVSVDDSIFAVTLPFSFSFDGGSYTSMNVSSNGFVSFGATAPFASDYGPLSTTTAYSGAVSAFGRDLQTGYTTISTRTLGSNQATAVSSVGPIQIGDTISGTGIPVGTTVTAIAGNVITMSANATATSTATAMTAIGPWAAIRSETRGVSPNQVFVVQWSGEKRFGTTLATVRDMTLNFQVLLYEGTGRMEATYGACTPGATTYTASPHHVGLRGPNNTFATNVNNRKNTKGVNDDWSLSVAGALNTEGMVFNNTAPANVIANGLTYRWDPPSGVPATSANYGTGCIKASATWYEQFGSFDLANSALVMIPNGAGGYTMTTGTPSSFVHTVPGLALTDDSVGTLTLPSSFAYPGGSTTSLNICSNGYIWTQTNTLADFSPSTAELFSNPARFCPLWCDTNPDGATNINNVFAEVDVPNNKAYVTWVNVPTFTAGGTINMQVEFDLSTGFVKYTYGPVTLPVITSIVGWTPGTGFSTADLGSTDVSASLAGTFSTSSVESLPLTLAASARPILNTTVTYNLSNIPAAALLSGVLVSVASTPALPLPGAPGCSQLIDVNAASVFLVIGSPTGSSSLFIPNAPAFVGFQLFTQAASLVPPANAFGVITSNGVASVVGNF